MLKNVLKSTVAAFALVASMSGIATAQSKGEETVNLSYGDIQPFYGDIQPFYGTINPFYGDIQPFYGDIQPFYGDINPFWGDIQPFYGHIDPFYGDINAFYDAIDAFYGDIHPFYGDINAFYGTINPFYGVIHPFYGNINPFYGNINPFYGDIAPFWGDIQPFWGDINPFWGDIQPFYGDIQPFYGDIQPFYGTIHPWWGDIQPFYGDINPFWGDIQPFYGDINAFWGDIGAFWGDIGPFWGDINAFWGDIGAFSTEDFEALASDLDSLFAQAEQVFGPAIQVSTGLSFEEAFLNDITARFGIDTSDPQSLADLSVEERSEFFLAFYDGLMSFTGIDHVDHWMAQVNWSPALSQRVGGGEGVTVGIVDFSLPYRIDGLRGGRGGAYLDFNHGLAVASLINAPMDGEGIMGVAENAALRVANPFDETLSTNFDDVTRAVRRLLPQSDIINLSLGVPGYLFHPDWADVLSDRRVARHADDTLFVFAAGTESVTEHAHVDWSTVGEVENLLLVGFTNPGGTISAFSNQPGEGCFLVDGACQDGYRFMDRFLVAPGELMLVPDGEGGVMRMSGSSFAAPLVSGAAALVQGHWSWLEAGDIASVLLWSAQDLGDPGVDAVYGWGLLDIDASFRPFDENNLYHLDRQGVRHSASELGILNGQILGEVDPSASIVMFEDFRDTFRDFEVALGALTLSSDESAGSENVGLTYLYDRNRERRRAVRRRGRAFTEGPLVNADVARSGSTVVRFSGSPLDTGERASAGQLPFQAGLEVADLASGASVRLGVGEGALAFSQGSAFGLASDHRAQTGGVNPVLGFASGGAYMSGGFALSERTDLNLAVTHARDTYEYVNPLTGEATALFSTLEAYSASAVAARVDHALTDSVSVNVGYTHLSEANALLGAQGLGALGFDGQTRTDAATFGAEAQLPMALSLAGSATLGRTHAGAQGPALALSDALVSTAFQVSLERAGLFGSHDAVRFSLIQPLHAETGTLSYSGQVVSNRQTGALETETQRWALSGERTLAAELLYATPLFGDMAGISVFARTEAVNARFAESDAEIVGGLRFDLDF